MQARTVKLGNYNSADLNITLISVAVSGAEPKLLKVDVPYSNGQLDMTDIFGDVRYNNREIEMVFHIPYGVDHWATYANVSNLFNGKKTTITFSADDGYYWEGRISVDQLACEDGKWAFTMIADVHPFKMKINNTIISGTVGTDGVTKVCKNLKMPVSPTFIFNGKSIIVFDSKTYSATESGTYSFPELILREGNNVVKIRGVDGNIDYQIIYKEGSL